MAVEERTTLGRAGLISIAAAGGALAGFFLQLIVAYQFGADTTTDAFFMAQSVGELISKLLLGGSIAAVALPLFVEHLALERRDQAWRLGNNLLHIMSFLLVALVLLVIVFAGPLVSFIAPGFDAETSALTVSLLRILAPSFLILFLVDLLTALLHALEKFNAPAALRVVTPLTSIVSLLLLFSSLGIFAWAAGVVVGAVVQLIILLSALRKQGWRYQFILDFLDPDIKNLAVLAAPFVLSMLVTQGAGIMYRILVSELAAGSLTSLKFAEKITQLVTIMFLNSVTIVIFPLLSKKFAQKDFVGGRDTIGSAIRLVTFATLPIIVGIALLREPLVELIYLRGSFTLEDAALTSTALLFMVIGLTTNGISSILGHAVVAMKETQAAVAVTIATQAVAIALFVLLVPVLGHAGLALAASLTPLAIAALYFIYLTRFIPNLWQVFQHKTFLKTFVLTAGLALAALFVRNATSELPALFTIILTAAAGGGFYFLGAQLWRVPEMQNLTEIFLKKANAVRGR